MNNWKFYHWALLATGIAAAMALTISGVQMDQLARIGAGYKAKVACSEAFVAGRDASTIIENEFNGIDPMMSQIVVTLDLKNKNAAASGPLGLGRARAAYREGYGCTLANGGRISPLPAPLPPLATDPWPEAPPISGKALGWIDYAALDAALTRAFDENTANHRSVLVIVDGKLVDERYAEGFTKDTPFLSWSMAKSVTATLTGAAVLRDIIDISDPAPVASWRSDPVRSTITWNDLLHMQSGLAFNEDYDNPRSDVNRMLFAMADTSAIAEKSASAHPPGEVWYYSSGTVNLISKLMRMTLTENGIDYYAFGREAIFEPIGAGSVIMEPDAAGNFIGSSYVYATARDWARLGQLYLQDGVWNGTRLLPEGWSSYVSTPAAASDNQYGALFWLNRDGKDGRKRFFSALPEEVYFMSGYEGQYVFIVPSKRMVIVRTGMSRGQAAMETTAPLIEGIYDAVGFAPNHPADGPSD
jgi:CubicO group peptidase (beta-lactamase class C family)